MPYDYERPRRRSHRASGTRPHTRTRSTETVSRGRKVPSDDSASLLESGLIDSLGILTLADEIKARFDCVVANDELAPENLDAVGAIVNYLLRKGASNG